MAGQDPQAHPSEVSGLLLAVASLPVEKAGALILGGRE